MAIRRLERKRYRQIVNIFAKYGFADIISEIGLSRYLPFRRRLSKTPTDKLGIRASNFRKALEELGPTFIKAGQFLSTRPDLLPPQYIEQLENLLDRISPFPFELVKKIIEEEFKIPLEQKFSSFSEVPVAAASLAQVHIATNMEGIEVAVKVQRPNINDTIKSDIAILKSIASLLTRYSPYVESYDLQGLVREFEQQLIEELDFRIEASNLIILKKNIKEFKLIKIPDVYLDYSGARVLTMERINGFKVSNMDKLYDLDEKIRSKLASQLLQAYLKQMLEDGFFHGDPHPGNIFVLPEGRIALLDLGIMGRLDSDIRGEVTKLLLSFVQQESAQITDLALRLATLKTYPDLSSLRLDVGRLVTKYYNRPAEQVNIGEALVELMRVLSFHRLRMPPVFGMLGKTMLYVDRICRQLDPRVNYVKFINQSSQKLLAERISTQFTLPKVIRNMMDANDFLFDLPPKVHTLLQKISEDNFGIRFEHVGLEKLQQTLDRTANRLAFALIVAGLIVSSSLVMRIPVGPFIYGYPALGVTGFLLAGVLGLYLIYTMLRTRGLK